MAEELFGLPDSAFVDDDSLFAFRLMLNVGLDPGATARDLSQKLGEEKQRKIERLLAKFRETGVLEDGIEFLRGSGRSQTQGPARRVGLSLCNIG